MGFFSAITSLFSGNTSESAKAVDVEASIEYNGFSITPGPIPEGRQYRVGATITKGEGETRRTHNFIRSDVVASRDECINMAIRKAKITIDQTGDNIFG